MSRIAFATDLHGSLERYTKLARWLRSNHVEGLFLGGDLLPGGMGLASPERLGVDDFISGWLTSLFGDLRADLGEAYPEIFLIMGNDDPKYEEISFLQGVQNGLWRYAHGRTLPFGKLTVCGYSFIPPSPFRLKDWERYDVSRFVDVGCVAPGEGHVTVPMSNYERNFQTITDDLNDLFGECNFERAIFLFHAPPYGTNLDLADLHGKIIDHVPLDPHIGSIAIERFIRRRHPLLCLHGHVHEAARLSGVTMEVLEGTPCYQGAHDGPELSLTIIETETPSQGRRILL